MKLETMNVTVTAKDMMDSAKSISATYNFSVTTAVTYNAKGFSNTSPFKHQNGTAYDSDGRDYQGYNEAGYNSEGYSSSIHQFIIQTMMYPQHKIYND